MKQYNTVVTCTVACHIFIYNEYYYYFFIIFFIAKLPVYM